MDDKSTNREGSIVSAMGESTETSPPKIMTNCPMCELELVRTTRDVERGQEFCRQCGIVGDFYGKREIEVRAIYKKAYPTT
jgi:hypothetical protein